MRYSEAKIGRIFILRLDHGESIPDVIEEFAREQQIESAIVQLIGGTDRGSKVVVGPEDGKSERPSPMITHLEGSSETLGIGSIFLNEEKIPKLHLHAAFGRQRETITGCTREGIEIWQVGEVIVMELTHHSALRKIDPITGFELLNV